MFGVDVVAVDVDCGGFVVVVVFGGEEEEDASVMERHKNARVDIVHVIVMPRFAMQCTLLY